MALRVVVSAVNMVDGGALTVLHEAIKAFDKVAGPDVDVTFLVADASVHASLRTPHLKFEYFPRSKKKWVFRLWYEYFEFHRYSRKHCPDVWFSLHDTTPNVLAGKRYVYCHNASVFLKFPLKDIALDPKQFVFSAFYKWVYAFNIQKNTAVIAQQAWMADALKQMFNLEKLLVAEPDAPHMPSAVSPTTSQANERFSLFYPAYPRYFKNHAVLLDAQRLSDQHTTWLTLDGKENEVSRRLMSQGLAEHVELLGMLSREQVYDYYQRCDALVFPSLLETWGLPLTEFKQFHKPIIAADLPYAHETLAGYSNIYWFTADCAQSLLGAIERARALQPADCARPMRCSHEKIQGWDRLARYIVSA